LQDTDRRGFLTPHSDAGLSYLLYMWDKNVIYTI